MTTVGVISDTHGLVRPEAIDALRDCGLIVHAGDVGGPDVLERLREIAPTIAVRGDNDTGAWGRSLPATEVVEVGELNPGSAGPRRFKLPVAVARLTVAGRSLSHEIIELLV